MRSLPIGLFWLLLLGASGCFTTNGTTSSKSDAGDAGSACDHKGNCLNCLTCAAGNACASLVNACTEDAYCQSIDQCMQICGGDLTCQQQCYTNNPSGVAKYNAANDCLYCDECPSDCSGERTCS